MSVRLLFFMTAWLTAATGCALSASDAASPTQDPAPPAAASDVGVPSPVAVEPDRAAGPAEPAAIPASSPAAASPSTPTPAPTSPRIVESGAFRIGPEDILDVQVWKNNELSRVVPVRPDGMISLPLVNDIRAAGLTAVELRDQVTQRLSEFVPSPEVSVIVREVHSVKVAVLGSVKMPGHYEVNSPSTVLELIARAQGLTEFADRGRIVVLRQNGSTTTRIPFNYRKVAEGSEQDNFFVRPGDIIVVP